MNKIIMNGLVKIPDKITWDAAGRQNYYFTVPTK